MLAERQADEAGKFGDRFERLGTNDVADEVKMSKSRQMLD